MVKGMLTDDVHNAGAGPLGVVQVGQSIAQSWPEMQQGGGWFFCHPVVAICGTGHHTLKEPQDAAHARRSIQRRDKVHF